jgi:hypothetical protein
MTTAQANPTGFSGDHGALTGLGDDDHLQYALLAGRALGQTLFGGTGAGELLTLQGSSNADRGQLNINSSTVYDWNWALHAGGALWSWATTIPASGGVIVAGLQIANNITVNSGLFIISAVDDLSTLRWTVSPGFAVSTLFFARPTYRSTSVGIPPAQAFIFAAQAQFNVQGTGAVVTANYRGLSFAPIMRAQSAGDSLTVNNTVGLYVGPLWNTNNGFATVDFGTIRGVHCANGSQVFLGQSLGTERCQNYIGLDMNSITMSTVGVRVAVRSALVVNAQNYFLQNNGGAQSNFGGGNLLDCGFVQCLADNVGLSLGAAGGDVVVNWNGTGLEFDPLSGADMRITFAALAHAITSSSGSGSMQLSFDYPKFAFGQSGTIGNQVGIFVAPTRTAGVGGGWADFLLTQAGSLSIGAFAMSDVSAWVINSISLAAGTGSIADLATLTVGGMTTSNPGITVTRRSAIRSQGRFQQSGAVAFPPIVPAALASGNNNDWAGLLTGSASNNTRFWARISGNATTSVLTGIDATAVQDGDTHELTNVSANTIDISHQNVASAAANRIISPTGATYQLAADETVLIRYDATTTRWRLLAGTGA